MHPENNRPDIKDLSFEQLIVWLKSHGLESYRAIQILKWVYIRQVDAFSEMTDLRKEVRQMLTDNLVINRLENVKVKESKDGTKKILFRLYDGNFVESVLIPEKKHYTICISSQVGCAQGCKFCLTAKGGFIRNLTPGEIIAQVRDIKNDLNQSKKLTNIVLMGMGEPLANYQNVINAIKIFSNTDYGLNFSNRRITISTAGLVPKLADLGRDTDASLAVSLNATENSTRDMLMPVNRKYPIETLLKACITYRMASKRKITIEYILIKDVNDSEKDAMRLVKLLRPIRAKINLIPFNEHAGSDFLCPDENIIDRFYNILVSNGYITITRRSKGRDISAACGQLSLKFHPNP
ncbi:MAG: 23S rRNA (adenine(2503)-C(2))-methyltransferase RlmN [Desulfosarcina sp.]|nr:23S rRNA (adenine(2503)-C(2))-methyltransferase RlmN [Desulfobacterales bacterium]